MVNGVHSVNLHYGLNGELMVRMEMVYSIYSIELLLTMIQIIQLQTILIQMHIRKLVTLKV
nr:MAG TPA: hypothetical protein [Bacteriophage sp.]